MERAALGLVPLFCTQRHSAFSAVLQDLETSKTPSKVKNINKAEKKLLHNLLQRLQHATKAAAFLSSKTQIKIYKRNM